eukprot:gene12306-16507_t
MSRVITSTHGKALLQELSDIKTAQPNVIMDYIMRDPAAGRMKVPETGDTSYHLLLNSGYNKDFILPILEALISFSPEGLKIKNKNNALPLHISLTQYKIIPEVVMMLLQNYPQSASIPNDQGLIPLFLCVMRDDISADICRYLCKLHSAGPAAMNRTRSHPLHFAAKKRYPNHEVLKILLRRFPEAARHANDFGLLPLHCLCSISDDVISAKMIYDAYPSAIKIIDRLGKTCLHLAVLAIGKDHSHAVTKEEEELLLEKQREESNQREGCKSRTLIRFLIEKNPQSLVAQNNFLSTPVQTVLEKTKPGIKSNKKIVAVFGLYDDPPTARLLLLSHRNYALSGLLPAMKSVNMNQSLKELNWLARKPALLLSLFGEPKSGSNEANVLEEMRQQFLLGIKPSNADSIHSIFTGIGNKNNNNNINNNGKTNNKNNHKKGSKKNNNNNTNNNELTLKRSFSGINDFDIPKKNLLARLRRRGD